MAKLYISSKAASQNNRQEINEELVSAEYFTHFTDAGFEYVKFLNSRLLTA